MLNYNTAHAVTEFYRQTTALRGGSPSSCLFLIVDNASNPADVNILRAFFAGRPDALLILNSVNRGYAAGNNVGLRRAAELGVEYCLIANSDIAILTPDFVERLVGAARTLPQCGLIGPRVVLRTGRPQGPLPETGIWNGVVPTSTPDYSVTREVYSTVGCCIFGATAVFAQVDFLDEGTFLYREEIILAERLRRRGLRWYYLPEVRVRHDHVRKLDSVEKIVRHKQFETESTIRYFRDYKQRSPFAIAVYRGLIALKTAAFICFVASRRALPARLRRNEGISPVSP